ncbi:MAG TPA: glycosyltransferase family 2 protein [Polyangiaceae bacterium]|jgi:glycosyltransferase involved in cell wall biosynthesis|nr:glycosyltransferase family 2 protein [Polyangiaceae bacterium]
MSDSVDVVIPIFNEAGTVKELHARLRAACPEARIVFVDNGSTDGTLAAIGALGDATLVRHETNLGYGQSILDGIAAGSGEYIVMIDADLEYLPEDVPAVVDALRSAPAVYGSRFLGRTATDEVMPAVRRFGNQVVTTLFNVLFARNLTDLYTGLRGVQRRALPASGLHRPGFDLVLELAARLALEGRHIAEVPVRYMPRTRGESKMRHVPEFLKFARLLVELRLNRPT